MGGNRRVSLLRQRDFRLLWIGETISQLGNAMAVVGMPLVAVIVLHASTFTLGVLTAAAWLPWLVNRITARFGTARGLLLSTLGGVPFALLIPLTGPGPRLAFYVVGALLTFAGVAVGNIIIAAFRQSYSPPGMCGRVTATMRFLIFGMSPLGALLGGTLGSWLGIRDALWILLGAAALSGTLLLTRILRGRRDLPDAAPEPREPALRERASR